MVRNKSIKGIITAIMTLCAVTSVYADVSCPSATDIKDGVRALNAVVRQSEKGFFVLTAQPAINASNLDWIIAAQTSANGFDAAFASGEKAVKTVMAPVTNTAIEQRGFFVCAYLSMGGMNVMAMAPKQQSINFNPAVINFDAFKQKR